MPMRVTGMNSGLDTDAMVQELVSAYKKKGEKNTKEKTKFEWKQEIWKDLNKKIQSFNKKIQNLKYSSAYNLKKTTSSDDSKVSVVASDGAVKGSQTVKVNKLAQATSITSGELKTLDGKPVTANTKLSELGITEKTKIVFHDNKDNTDYDFEFDPDNTVGLLLEDLRIVGVDANLDTSSGRLFINAKDTGVENGFSLKQVDENGNAILDANGSVIDGKAGADILGKLGLRKFTDAELENKYNAPEYSSLTAEEKAAKIAYDKSYKSATIIDASDAEIEYNGAKFRSTNNNFSINGLSITAKGLTTGDEKVTLTTENDTEGIYKQIKSILKDYSELINEMDKLYNADKAKGYEPLTDDEKDAMSEKEVEKWEQKIKDSLLRRDSTVAGISNAMKQSALMSFKVNGKNMTLADFGIGTLGYFKAADNERNALHIDGDEDDEAVSSEANKLKKMIADDPEAVSGFFSQFLQELSDRFTNLSSSTSDRSYGSFYNDKKAKTELTKHEKKVSDWEAYVTRMEDKYYKQFSKMETQLAKMQNTQQSMQNYFQ